MRSERSDCIKLRKGPEHVYETMKGKTAEVQTEHWQQRMMDTRRWLEHRQVEKGKKRAAAG